MPHSTAWRSLYSAGSKAGGRPPALPLFLRWRIWSAFSGMVHRIPRQAQVGAVGPGAVGLVRQHPAGTAPGPPRAGAGHPDARQHGLELRAVTTLARGDQDRQRFLALLAGQVHLGGQPAPGPAQRVIIWLGHRPAGRLGLQITAPAGPGGVLVRPGDGGVHAHIPGDQPLRIRPALQPGQDLAPGAVALPAAEQAIHRLPRPVGRRHIAPRRPGPHPPPDPVNQRALRVLRGAAPVPAGQQRPQRRPLRVRQVRPPAHR